jgi:hypothetical protein
VATLLEPFDESLPDKSGVASAKSVEEEAFDAENDGMSFFLVNKQIRILR